MQPETKFKIKVIQDLRRLKRCWVEKIQQVSIRGTPDLVICLDGVFVGFELKKSKHEKPDALQLANLRKIKKSGGVAMTVYPETWPQVYKELKSFLNSRLSS